jgi:hypothetical protein
MGGQVGSPEPPAHGIEVVFGDDWVEFVDALAPDRPSVRFTRAEYVEFVEGVRKGDFDVPPAGPGPEA